MDATAVAQRTDMREVKAKFMLLLETARTSAEFERLYMEVDEALTRLMEFESSGGDSAT